MSHRHPLPSKSLPLPVAPSPLRTITAALCQSITLLSVAGAVAVLSPALAWAEPVVKPLAKRAVKPVSAKQSLAQANTLKQIAAIGDTGPACQKGNGTACQIIYTVGAVGHGQPGQVAPGIDSSFTSAETLTAIDGPNGWGAIQFETTSGDGGAADSDGQNGGNGGQGNNITAVIGSGVTAQGGNSGGILRFTATAGNGGGGQGAHKGTIGTGGTGGGGGAIDVTMNGAVTSTNPDSPGLLVLSQGGSSLMGDAGDDGFYGAYSGNGGGSNAVTVTIGGSISTVGTGAMVAGIGGNGGTGVNDNGSLTLADARAGGNGGSSVLLIQATVTGRIASSGGDGIDVLAQGGNGGNGGVAANASSSYGGGGGNAGSAPAAQLTISGSVSGAKAGAAVQSLGGAGGAGGASVGNDNGGDNSTGGTGGSGGDGGASTLTLQAGASIVGGTVGAYAASGGGAGGLGAAGGGASATGGNGGVGGVGQTVVVDIGQTTSAQPPATTITTAANVAATGVAALSYGGAGGAGAAGDGYNFVQGGTGGTGGNAGTATLALEAGASVTTQGADTASKSTAVLPGVLVRSNGGAGGNGGNGEAGVGTQAGDAGAGGNGSTVAARISGTVTTSGSFAYGVLAQSVGGAGADGGDAKGVFGAHGGAGRNGGQGGPVDMSGSAGSITTTGSGAAGMVAQSIGGGGGSGGNALTLGGGLAIGGNGGAGGNGQNVTVGYLSTDADSRTLSNTIVTRGDSATALIAQSIGGAGGNGGNAVTIGSGLPSLSIGGDGKDGATGGTVSVQNDGLVTTQGQQSGGVNAQSVGGGGGNGGAAVALNGSVQVSTSFALGGTGAGGGAGGSVNLVNNNQVSTYGADSFGLKAQSVGGGGGQGGSAISTAIALGGDPEIPTISVSIALGGSGGGGGDQSQVPVTVTNNALITTAGDGSIGIIAQSIAGGGGNGGDSTASSYSSGGSDSTNITASASVGGKGGGGGTGGAVTVTNNGLLATMGADAYGVFAQSVGGGGGTGGTGDASASAGKGESSYSGAVTVGGNGGKASAGGAVTVNNNGIGNIATQGDGANAIFAQSVGGGGGASGGGTSKANGGDLTAAVTVGGNAGKGGEGGTVTVTNLATLLTKGAEADAIFAQSVGGGGGKAGKGASNTGGTQDPKTAIDNMSASIASGFGITGAQVTKITDGVYKIGDATWKGIDGITALNKLLGGGVDLSLRDDDDDGTADNLKLNATIGGQGGSGGAGNAVTVTNAGTIETDGTKTDAIFAQSVGGGGGVGGASSFSGSESSGGKDTTNGSLKVGGDGVGGGAGGVVSVTNTGAITTTAVASHGIDAQSIGGGGGKGGATAASNGALKDFNAKVGGSGGIGGDGNTVTVTHDGAISTAERASFGILAQSVGGGGGAAHLLSSDISLNPSGNDMKISATLGGSGGAGGNGAKVEVDLGNTATGSISTKGAGGIGVVAQSIGGGGGLLVTSSTVADANGGGSGGGINGSTVIPLGIGDAGGSSGNGGEVDVTLGVNHTAQASSIITSKADAYGILAQSIGGGGGLFAGATPGTELAKLYAGTNQVGNGGNVNVNLDNGGWIYTSGVGAVGVLAQSIGGGGGLIGGMSNVNLASGLQTNPTAESGQGGNVTVDLESGGNIVTTGANAHGIFAQAVGGGGGVVAGANGTGYAYAGASPYTHCGGSTNVACTGNVSVTVEGNSVVRAAGQGAYAVYVQSRGNGSNDTYVKVGVGGFIESWGQSAGGIYIDGAGTNTVDNYGTIDDGYATNKGIVSTAAVAIAGSQVATVNNYAKSVVHGAIDLPSGSMVNNLSGATLNSSSIDLHGAASRLVNAGTLEIGGTSVSALQVNASFEQQASGKLMIDVDGVSRLNDTLRVQSGAKIGGQLVLRPTTLTPDAIAVVHGATGADLSSLSVTDVGGGQLFSYQARLDGDTISVTPTAKLGTAARGASFGGARLGLADHLQQGFVSGASRSQGVLYAQLATLPTAKDYRLALDNLSGETLQAAAVSVHAASLDFSERMNSCPTLDQTGAAGERGCAWTRAIDTQTHRSSSNEASGYSGSTHTMQAGGQVAIGNGWFLGGSFAYDGSSTSATETSGNVSGNGGSIGVVVKREVGAWIYSGSLDYGRSQYDTQRSISVGQIHSNATGQFDLTHYGVHGRIAYRMPQDGWYLKPYLDAHAVRMQSGAFDETGAGDLNLQVGSHRGTIFSLSPMVEIGAQRLLVNDYTVRGFVAVGALLHNGDQWGASSSLQGTAASGATPFSATAALPDRQAKLNLGVDFGFTPNSSLRLEYGGAYGNGYQSQSVSAKLSVLF